MRPRFFHRGLSPPLDAVFLRLRLTKNSCHPLEDSGRCHSACRPPAGGSVPWRPSAVMRNAEHSFPRIAPSAGHKFVLNPCRRAAHRNYSLFSFHSPGPAAYRTPAVPPHFPGTPENCSPQGRGNQFSGDPRWLSGHAGTFYPLTVLPRRNLTPRHSPPYSPGLPRNCSPQGQGASLFHGDMIK